MVVLPDVSAGRKRQFGDAKLVLSVDLVQKASEWSFELYFGDQPFGVDLHRAPGGLRRSFARVRCQSDQWQNCERLQNVTSDILVVRHSNLLTSAAAPLGAPLPRSRPFFADRTLEKQRRMPARERFDIKYTK